MAKKSESTERKEKPQSDPARLNGVAVTIGLVLIGAAVLGAFLLDNYDVADWIIIVYAGLLILIGLDIMLSLKIAAQWEKAVILRLGRFHELRGPGIFWIVPVVDVIAKWIDHRVMVTPFNAEKTLTKDTVPVDVDAVLFWMVWDAEKAALEVADYFNAIGWAAQTALREVIGQMSLADILVGRAKMDAELQKIIDERTNPWGVTVQSVEIH
jgi:regulator of protease activity HflC (stomatin/prohibitin superfamily)